MRREQKTEIMEREKSEKKIPLQLNICAEDTNYFPHQWVLSFIYLND